jgi:choline dehydrogenase-like flavoprotein
MDTTKSWDAIVVGSGITGGWAAKELTERGLRVVMIERGRNVEHAKDYTTEHLPPWKFPFRERGNPKVLREDYPIQSIAPGVSEDTWHFFVKDPEHPYVQAEGTEFAWIRGYQLGGRSLTWGRQVYRWSDLDFEANATDGHGVDWPIRYTDVAPWYDHVESFIGVSGQAEGLPQLPDGRFLPPMEMTCAETHFKGAVESQWPDRRVTMGRTATLTVDHGGRQACHYCGPCGRGCSTGSYFSTQSSTLPAAQATGRLELRTDSVVEKVLYDAEQKKATGVAVVDAKTGERSTLSARVVFLCASTVATTRILLSSTSETFPNGLANRSGVLGRYLMDHTIGFGAFGIFPQFAGQQAIGNRPNNVYIPRFQNVGTRHPDFVRGYGYQGMGLPIGWSRGSGMPGFGAEWKDALAGPAPWMMFLGGFGECLPQAENRVTLEPSQQDEHGIPRVHIAFQWSDNERAMRRDVVVQAQAMLEAAGAVNVVPGQGFGVGGEAIHEMGTARMGRDSATSVLNANNQAHDVPNLFVTDGSCMTSSACQNPSLTYMALTARAAAFATDEMEKGAL